MYLLFMIIFEALDFCMWVLTMTARGLTWLIRRVALAVR